MVALVRMVEMTEWVRLCSFRGVAWLCWGWLEAGGEAAASAGHSGGL